ncbi:MAG: hypothetical protein CMH54_05910 [Myxococcales bacterium]|nr:hypothetical protein [Myxococcales bacterium]|tara:strand:+ start:1589 stop:2347 length:759 start_codon:yes stop_codon:yes gene_type:complete
MKQETALFGAIVLFLISFPAGVLLSPKPVAYKAPVQVEAKKPTPKPPSTMLGKAPRIGKPDAPVKMLVVSDFQCPVCRRAAVEMSNIHENLDGNVVIFFIQNPLKMHPRAMPAAQASTAAHQQGKFWEYHDLIFADQRSLSDEDLRKHATTLGLDMEQYDRDRNDPDMLAHIQKQAEIVTTLGARGTPAFFINGKKHVGWGSRIGTEGYIKKEQAQVEALLEKGLSPEEAYRARVLENSENSELFLTHFSRM